MAKFLSAEGFDMNLLEEFENEDDLTSYLQCKFGCAELCDMIVREIDKKLSLNEHELG